VSTFEHADDLTSFREFGYVGAYPFALVAVHHEPPVQMGHGITALACPGTFISRLDGRALGIPSPHNLDEGAAKV